MKSAGLVSVVFAPLTVILIACLGLFVGGYSQYMLALAFIAVTIGVSLVLVVGLARMITLASGAMMAIGAYGLVLLMIHLHVDILVGMLAAAFVGGLAGLVLGILTTRFRGHHLAMVTLVFQFVVIIVLREWPDLTGGAQGIWAPKGTLLGIPFDTDTELLLLASATAAVTVGLTAILVSGHFGKCLLAISSTEVGAEAYGIDLAAFRIAAFCISSAFIALAGGVHALQVRVLEPEAYGVLKSVSMLAYPIVGGLTSIWGGLIGGGLLRLMPEGLRFVADYQELVYSALVIAIMIVSPDGIVGLARRFVGVVDRPGSGSPKAEASKDETPASASGDAAPPFMDRAIETERVAAMSASADSARPTAAALQISGLSKSFFALTAVDDISFTVPAQSIYGIIGPNGAGKTTLFNLISGFLAPDQGTIALFGEPVNQVAVRKRVALGMTRTFQNVAIYRQLSCMDNVLIGLGQNGVAGSLWKSVEDIANAAASKERRRRAMESLEEVGLGQVASRPAGSLSLGNQRRLEIARALASRPKLLMLDEPVSGLDLDEEERIRELLLTINARFGMTMLVIEHNIRFIVNLSQMLSVMHMGSLVVEGLPHQVVELPEVRRIYFGEGDRAA